MTDWLLAAMQASGYAGIFLLLALARLIPPIPAESVVPLAGLGAATGEYSLLGIAVAGGLGSTAGELLWYLPSRLWPRERLEGFLRRYGHWLTIRPDRVRSTTDWFAKRGWIAVLLAQPVPGARTLIAIPAGACGMPAWRFSLGSAIGSIAWTGLLAGIGYAASWWPAAREWFGEATVALFLVLLALYIARLVPALKASRRPPDIVEPAS